MKRAPRIMVAFDTRTGWERELLRGVAAFVEQEGKWDCEYSMRPCTLETVARAEKADGLIATVGGEDVEWALARWKKPVVAIGRHYVSGIPHVYVDGAAIGRAAAEHLLERGFRRFAWYAGSDPAPRRTRWEAFANEVEAAGCVCEGMESCCGAERAWRESHVRLKKWVKGLGKPVGIFCVNDEFARELAMACVAVGVKVPEDAAILGVNNDELLCTMCKPRLSSIDNGLDRMGFEAARMLHEMLRSGRRAEGSLWEPSVRVVMRDSTNVVAARGEHVPAAVGYIQEHLSAGVTVKELLRELKVGRRTLEIAFREQLGRTIHEEIVRARIHRATCLLLDGNMAMSEVAARCGVADQARFSTMFKKETGETPGQYRRGRQLR